MSRGSEQRAREAADKILEDKNKSIMGMLDSILTGKQNIREMSPADRKRMSALDKERKKLKSDNPNTVFTDIVFVGRKKELLQGKAIKPVPKTKNEKRRLRVF
jgi:hypothetical protein